MLRRTIRRLVIGSLCVAGVAVAVTAGWLRQAKGETVAAEDVELHDPEEDQEQTAPTARSMDWEAFKDALDRAAAKHFRNPYAGHSVVRRDHLGPELLANLQTALRTKWPQLRELAFSRIAADDRVAFVAESGSRWDSRTRELLTGVVVAADADEVTVGLTCVPQDQCCGLRCLDTLRIPRASVVGWAAADSAEHEGDFDDNLIDDPNPARFVRAGDTLDLMMVDQPGLRWAIEPAGAGKLEVLEHANNRATVALRRARPGRLGIVAYARDDYGESVAGLWPIVVAPGRA